MNAELLRQATGCTAEAAERYAAPLSAACAFYGIDTPVRQAAFLAQIGHESGSLRYVAELWGPTPAQARYEGRADLGNTQPGDGERFKGHGLIQTTGRYNHARVRDRLRERFPDVPDFEADPEALTDPQWAVFSAADYWDDRGLNALADAGDFERITRKINGGLNGYADRKARWVRASRALAPATETITVAADGSAETTATAPPPKEATMSLPAILGALLPTFVQAIPAFGALFAKGNATAERNVKAVELAVGIVQDAVGARNAQEAAEIVASDPQAAQTAQAAIEARWFELRPADGGGIEGARKADSSFSIGGANPLRSPALLISVMLFSLPMMLAVDLFYAHPDNYPSELRTQIVTAILLVIGMVGAFWLGSSFGSTRKTEIQAGQQ